MKKTEIIFPKCAYETAINALERAKVESRAFLQELLDNNDEEAIYAMNAIKRAAEDGYTSTHVKVSLKMLGILDGIGYSVEHETCKVTWSDQTD